jgi:hypothetical protein
MKKVLRIEPYCYKTWSPAFKQIGLISPYITYNPEGHFVESGVSSWLLIVSFNILIWDFGFRIYYDLEY